MVAADPDGSDLQLPGLTPFGQYGGWGAGQTKVDGHRFLCKVGERVRSQDTRARIGHAPPMTTMAIVTASKAVWP
ncbi:hypothetical protein, partial [Prauserella alba]